MSVDPGTMEVTETEIFPYEEDDDGTDGFAHYVRPADNGVYSGDDPTTAKDIIDVARMTGSKVVALCGFEWVPKRNPKAHPVCQMCVEVAIQIQTGQRH